jgi:hypothetical protein
VAKIKEHSKQQAKRSELGTVVITPQNQGTQEKQEIKATQE